MNVKQEEQKLYQPVNTQTTQTTQPQQPPAQQGDTIVPGLPLPLKYYFLRHNMVAISNLPPGCKRCGQTHNDKAVNHNCPAERCQVCGDVSWAHHGLPCPMVLVTLAQAKKFYGFPQRYVPTSRRYMRFLASDNDIDALVAAGFAVRLPDNNGFSWTAAAMTVYNNSSWMDDPPAVRDSQVFANATSIKQEANAGPANTQNQNQAQQFVGRGAPANASGSSARSGSSWRSGHNHRRDEENRRRRRREEEDRQRQLQEEEDHQRRMRQLQEDRERRLEQEERILNLQFQLAMLQQSVLQGAFLAAGSLPLASGGAVSNQALASPFLALSPHAVSRPSQPRTNNAGRVQKPYAADRGSSQPHGAQSHGSKTPIPRPLNSRPSEEPRTQRFVQPINPLGIQDRIDLEDLRRARDAATKETKAPNRDRVSKQTKAATDNRPDAFDAQRFSISNYAPGHASTTLGARGNLGSSPAFISQQFSSSAYGPNAQRGQIRSSLDRHAAGLHQHVNDDDDHDTWDETYPGNQRRYRT